MEELLLELPIGSIVPVNASTLNGLPAGWFLANGANGTLDLRDRFIQGTRGSAVKGGSDTGNISFSSKGNHSHVGGTSGSSAIPIYSFSVGGTSISTTTMGSHNHRYGYSSTTYKADGAGNVASGNVWNPSGSGYTQSSSYYGGGGSHNHSYSSSVSSHSHTWDTGDSGGHGHSLSASWSNLPAYVYIPHIQRVS